MRICVRVVPRIKKRVRKGRKDKRGSRMKKVLTIIFFSFFLILNSLVFAHPPTDIIFNYNAKSKILSVGIVHSVKDSKKHFIKEVNIKVNGKEWITQKFTSQPTADVQASSYAQVELKKGDVIEVLAVCNEKGELKKTFKIE
jgi:desulfoferrodoxin (superoxide reductase-like protein)